MASERALSATEDERHIIHTAIQDALAADPLDCFTSKLQVALDGVEHTLAPQPG